MVSTLPPQWEHMIDSRGAVSVQLIFVVVQKHLDAATMRTSGLPAMEIVAPFGARRSQMTRLPLSSLYDGNGTATTDEKELSRMIKREWSPTFAPRELVSDDAAYFLGLVPSGVGATQWGWPRGRVAEVVAASMPMSAPGLDGLPYAFLALSGEEATSYLDSVASEAAACTTIGAAHYVGAQARVR